MITLRYAQAMPEAKPGVIGKDGKTGVDGEPGVAGVAGPAGVTPAPDVPVDHIAAGGSTVTLDLAASRIHRIVAQGDFTIALSGGYNGIKFSVAITQDGTGTRLVTWFANIRWSRGGVAPTLTVTANKRDVFGFEQWGAAPANWDGFVIGNNI